MEVASLGPGPDRSASREPGRGSKGTEDVRSSFPEKQPVPAPDIRTLNINVKPMQLQDGDAVAALARVYWHHLKPLADGRR